MKKVSLVFAMTAVLTLALVLQPGTEVQGWQGECDCGPDQYTSIATKAAADCLWVTVAIASAVRPEISCPTECLDTFEWTTACHQIGPGLWQGSGRIHYQCGTCEI